MSKELKHGDFRELDLFFTVIAQSDDMVEAIEANLPNEGFALTLIKIIETLLEEYPSESLAKYIYAFNVAGDPEDPRLTLEWYRDTIALIAKDRFGS